MSRTTQLLCGLALAGLISAPALAADDPMAKAVKARQGYMQVLAINVGQLAAMAKGKKAYDAEAAQMAADNLKLAAQMKNGVMWPAGSGNDNNALETRALPKIWAADSKVGEKSKAFKMAAAELADVAGNGMEAMKPKFAALGKSCKGCHKEYRLKKK